jgi:two-component system osmolarity sensor histidine kinase EnvZ
MAGSPRRAWLSRLAPASLRARTLWLVLLLVVFSEGLTFLMLFQLRDDTVRRMAESLVRANVSLVREALRSSTPEAVSAHLRGAGMVRLVRSAEVEGDQPLFRRPDFVGPRQRIVLPEPEGGAGPWGGPNPWRGPNPYGGPHGEGAGGGAAGGPFGPGRGRPHPPEGRPGGPPPEGRPGSPPPDPPWGRPPWSDLTAPAAPAVGEGAAARGPALLPAPVRRWLMGLEREFGPGSVRILPPPRATVSIRVLDDWWMVIPFHRFEPAPPLGWGYVLAWALAALLGALLVGLFAAHIARPLAALARAADEFADGRRPPALAPRGPREVSGLIERFNAMVERIGRADDERRVLLAGLPHDLRAPLTRMKLRLALLEDDSRGGFERDLRDIERIAAQFVDYLRGVDLSAVDAQPFDLAELVTERVAAQREVGRALELAFDDGAAAPAAPYWCRGDARLVARVVDNLLENAFAHGAPPVTLRLASKPAAPPPSVDAVTRPAAAIPPGEARGWLCLEVCDAGPGIAPERRAEALRPFTRLDAARGAGGHSGLGLALVERLVALHGGAVELGAAQPQGLRVRVWLPAA